MSLEELWSEQDAQIAQLGDRPELRGTGSMMKSQANYDRRAEMIRQAQASKHSASLPVDANSPQRLALADELREMQTQYGTIVFEIRNTQTKWLSSAARNWRHKLAGTISADCFNEPPPASQLADGWDCWSATSDLKKLIEAWRPRLTWARQIQAQLNAAKAFDSLPPGEQSLELVHCLARQHTAITDRCERIEAQLSAHEARLNPPKRRKGK